MQHKPRSKVNSKTVVEKETPPTRNSYKRASGNKDFSSYGNIIHTYGRRGGGVVRWTTEDESIKSVGCELLKPSPEAAWLECIDKELIKSSSVIKV